MNFILCVEHLIKNKTSSLLRNMQLPWHYLHSSWTFLLLKLFKIYLIRTQFIYVWVLLSIAFCLCVFLSPSYTHTHTCTGLALSHSKQQRAQLHLAAAPCSSCIRAGAQRHRGTRREQSGVVPASTPTSSPPLIPWFGYQRETRIQCLQHIHLFSHGNRRVSQRPITHQPAGTQLRGSHAAFILYKINPGLPKRPVDTVTKTKEKVQSDFYLPFGCLTFYEFITLNSFPKCLSATI